METTKKTWTRPQLIVLVRSRPEEAVLLACKALEISGDPNNMDMACVNTVLSVCDSCSSFGGS